MIGALVAAATRAMGSGAARGAIRGAVRSEARTQVANSLVSRFSNQQPGPGYTAVSKPTPSSNGTSATGPTGNMVTQQINPGMPTGSSGGPVDLLNKINTNILSLGETIRTLMVPPSPAQPVPDATQAGVQMNSSGSGGDIMKALIAFGAPIIATAYEAFKKFLDATQPYIEDIRKFVGEHIVPFLTEQLPNFFTNTLPAFFTITIPDQFQKAFTTIDTKITESIAGLKTTINSIRKNIGKSMVALADRLPSIIPQSIRDGIRTQGQTFIDQSNAADQPAPAAVTTPAPQATPVAPTSTGSAQDTSRATAAKYMDIRPGVDYDGLQAPMKRRLVSMAKELYDAHGQKPIITSANRTYEQQAELYRRLGPGRAAAPGRSAHEGGSAVDIDSRGVAGRTLFGSGLLDKYGFIRPVRNEPWHVTPKELGGRRGAVPDNPDNPGAPIAVTDSSGAPVIPATGNRAPGGTTPNSSVQDISMASVVQPSAPNVPPAPTGATPVASPPNNTGSIVYNSTMALTNPGPPAIPSAVPPTAASRSGSQSAASRLVLNRDITFVPDVDVAMDDLAPYIFYRAV